MTVFLLVFGQAALEGQKGKLEGDIARHLAFIDRLLADKDQLSAKCQQLGKDIKVQQLQMTVQHCTGATCQELPG